MTFIEPDLIADETTNAEAALAGIADAIPGWEAAEHHVETVLAESWGASLATAFSVARDDLTNAYLGLADVLDVARGAAVPATTTSTWVLAEPAPTTIPVGVIVSAELPDGSFQDFLVSEEWPVAGTLATGVPLEAAEPGKFANGATGEAFTSELPVASIMLDAPSVNGEDEEDLPTFLGKLRDRARRMRALAITPEDYAAMALDVPQVGRAYARNRFNPNLSGDAPGDVTVFALDDQGQPLGAAGVQALQSYFTQEDTVAGTQVYVGAPGLVPIQVEVQLARMPGADTGQLQADARAAILERLGPQAWDVDETAPGRWSTEPQQSITRYHVAAAVDDLPACRAVLAASVGGAGSVALPAPVSIPVITEGSVTVTVI